MPPAQDNSRNTIIFIVCAMALLIVYQMFVMGPANERRAAAEAKAKAAAVATGGAPGAPTLPGVSGFVPRGQALAASPRVPIDTPALKGSLSLKGAMLDDLFLKDYRAKQDSPEPVELLRPKGARYAYFMQTGWAGANLPNLPDANTLWALKSGSTLAPGQPVSLSYDNGQGLIFDRTIEVDDKFMFKIVDTVTNRAANPISLAPFGSVQRLGLENPRGAPGVHEGRIHVLGSTEQYILKVRKYAKWKKDNETTTFSSNGGWLGITDKYWLSALIPDQKESFNATFRVAPVGEVDIYESAYLGATRNIQPNYQATTTTHLFAGAKRVPILKGYEDALAIPKLEDAIDWTNIYFITKPIFWLIEFFYGWVGNFGIAILMMTVVVKVAFFYPTNLSFSSGVKMKKIQPQLTALKERHADDPAGQQKAMMELFKQEKINPVLGCLPVLFTIPVFLGLFYVLNVTIEMRHAPFYGWIQDLSAPDPTTIWNLFGALPWHPENWGVVGDFLYDGFARLGAWPLLYGLTMWLTQSMTPPAGDPMQQKIIQWMPVIFTFVMVQFAAGLLIYYVWSNCLSIIQQYLITRRHKVDNPIDAAIRKLTGKPKPAG